MQSGLFINEHLAQFSSFPPSLFLSLPFSLLAPSSLTCFLSLLSFCYASSLRYSLLISPYFSSSLFFPCFSLSVTLCVSLSQVDNKHRLLILNLTRPRAIVQLLVTFCPVYSISFQPQQTSWTIHCHGLVDEHFSEELRLEAEYGWEGRTENNTYKQKVTKRFTPTQTTNNCLPSRCSLAIWGCLRTSVLGQTDYLRLEQYPDGVQLKVCTVEDPFCSVCTADYWTREFTCALL